jgi:lysophospholipase L1-like esterase
MARKVLLFISAFALVLIVSFVLAEGIVRLVVFREDAVYQSIYESLIYPYSQPAYIPQPYLNYINQPGLINSRGEKAVNRMGLRYPKETSVLKPDSTFRILFIGGSTTFGDVDDTFDMFHTIIEKRLKDSLRFINPAFKEIECLNAGVHALSSAEILTHYLFKYQYLEPDLIVVHTGVNDAFAYCGINQSKYQPDYHNSRRSFRGLKNISQTERKLFGSKLFAFFYIQFLFSEYLETSLESNAFFHFTNDYLWFDIGSDSIPKRYNAFYQNMQNLICLAKNNGHAVLLFSEVIDTSRMPLSFRVKLSKGLYLHIAYMQELAQKHGINFLLADEKLFQKEFFKHGDGIHVNSEGEKLKAYLLYPQIRSILETKERRTML